MLTLELLTSIFNSFAFVLNIIGVLVAIAGGLVAIYKITVIEISQIKPQKKERGREKLRIEFEQLLIFSLEFFLAGSIIRAIMTTSWYNLEQLAAITVIWLALNYFLIKKNK